MRSLVKIVSVVPVAAAILAATSCFALEKPKLSVPLIEMMQEGKAKVAPDKTTIVDDKGGVVARETAPPKPSVKKPVNEAPAETGEKGETDSKEIPPYKKYFFTCSYKCGLTVKKCYQETSGFVICVNICDKESFVCEQREY